MNKTNKKILIFDEAGFSRICSALLEKEGYGTNAVTDVHHLESTINYGDIGLVITSYPYGSGLLKKLKNLNIPTIVLSDRVSNELMTTLAHFEKTSLHYMIKPLDYNQFRTLINQVMHQ